MKHDITLSVRDIRLLAELDRKMDSGEQPYVLIDGLRHAFSAEILAHFGIESGQTLSRSLLKPLVQAVILNLRKQMETEEASDAKGAAQ